MASSVTMLNDLHKKCEERRAHTADQKEKWVEAGLQEYDLEQLLESLNEEERKVSSLCRFSQCTGDGPRGTTRVEAGQVGLGPPP